jgi:RNA polymerase primary sigma factor
MHAVQREGDRLTQELGRQPTAAEIAPHLALTPERVLALQARGQAPVSLESLVGAAETGRLTNCLADTRSPPPLPAVAAQAVQEEVGGLLAGLGAREQRVLRLRFGLEDDSPRTLAEVGRDLGLTRERIRQIEAAALRKLRVRTRGTTLADLLAD